MISLQRSLETRRFSYEQPSLTEPGIRSLEAIATPTVRPMMRSMTRKGIRAYRAASAVVVLTHAPVVRIKYIHFSEDNGYRDASHSEGGMEISGICLPQTCEDGLMWGTTYKDDLFAKEPPLTSDQTTAEAMRVMASSAFWAKAARENGITDLSTVETMSKKALVDLELTLGDANYEI
jgi:hypothetical protein